MKNTQEAFKWIIKLLRKKKIARAVDIEDIKFLEKNIT